MRPIDKGSAPKRYLKYGDARHDLAGRIGYYCSYCEMQTWNMIEVEHVHSVNKGGNSLDWNNFLLSCKYCNTVKKNRNDNRAGYVWPDIDNTDLVFDYDEFDVITPKSIVPDNIKEAAIKTINLMGLNRAHHLPNKPTFADTRWRTRHEAWDKAKRALNNWNKLQEGEMANQIADTASSSGHYSIWCTVFSSEPILIEKFQKKFKGTFVEKDSSDNRIVRTGSII